MWCVCIHTIRVLTTLGWIICLHICFAPQADSLRILLTSVPYSPAHGCTFTTHALMGSCQVTGGNAQSFQEKPLWSPDILEGPQRWKEVPIVSVYPEQYQFSHSVMSDSLQPHEPQHIRPACPSPAPRVYPNWCPLSWWYHPTISSSVIPFSSCPQSFPESGSFQMSQLFASGSQSIGVSASISVLPMNIQDWFFL